MSDLSTVDLGALKMLLDALRARGVSKFSGLGLAIEFGELSAAIRAATIQMPPEVAPPASPVGVENGGMPTEEQLLEWSTGQPLPRAAQEPQ